jgi:predicted DNA-binding transcriptional regulator AlpA
VYVKYEHLVEQGIIASRPQLARWTEREGFPKAIVFGPNSLRWDLTEVNQWIATRERRAPKVWPNKKRMAAKAARAAATAAAPAE